MQGQSNEQSSELDKEWMKLIESARNIGMTIEEIREFLAKGKE
ncbi:anti-repressor SinI family protein [Halalkalibacter okhensis]|nr:anti-repressor SinI family protein [Halalkalibacter okhensis]